MRGTSKKRTGGLQLPIDRLSGVSAQIRKDFRRLHIATIGDLLRITGRRLHRAFKGRVEWPQVRNWRATAALLEIEGMTVERAQRLVADGTLAIPQFSARPVDSLQRLLKAGSAEAPALTRMLTDAVLLYCSGVVMGTVRDVRGRAVRGARVRAGSLTTTTDAYGRFRLSRIPLWAPVALDISAARFRTQSLRIERAPAYQVTTVRKVTLRRGTSRGSQGAARPRMLSELAGDAMPPMTGASVQLRDVAGRPPRRELVHIASMNRGQKRARMVSRLRRFEDGVFVAAVYRVPLADLPDDVEIGHDFRVSRTSFTRVTLSPKWLLAYKRLLRLPSASATPRPRSLAGIRVAVHRRLKEMIAAGVFTTGSPKGSDHA